MAAGMAENRSIPSHEHTAYRGLAAWFATIYNSLAPVWPLIRHLCCKLDRYKVINFLTDFRFSRLPATRFAGTH